MIAGKTLVRYIKQHAIHLRAFHSTTYLLFLVRYFKLLVCFESLYIMKLFIASSKKLSITRTLDNKELPLFMINVTDFE